MLVAILVALAVSACALGGTLRTFSFSTTAMPAATLPSGQSAPYQPPRQTADIAETSTATLPSEQSAPYQPPRQTADVTTAPAATPPAEQPSALGPSDGVLLDGTTVFDDAAPGIAKLNPALLGALREAATDAENDGITFFVTSGWRSPEYQNQLLREAIAEYGSEAEATRWVATADTSPHVSGNAVDIGSFDAIAWLSERGTRYGLCQIYHNEPWHYELRPEAMDYGCPPMYADPTLDPRMER